MPLQAAAGAPGAPTTQEPGPAQGQERPGRSGSWRTTGGAEEARGDGAQGARLGPRGHTLRDRRQFLGGAQGPLQAGHAPLGELHVRQVRRARPQGAPQLHRLHRAALRVSLYMHVHIGRALAFDRGMGSSLANGSIGWNGAEGLLPRGWPVRIYIYIDIESYLLGIRSSSFACIAVRNGGEQRVYFTIRMKGWAQWFLIQSVYFNQFNLQ